MANVYITSPGTSGPRGNGWLTGSGAPSNTLGFDGDYYLDSSNTSAFYGPKTGGVWGSPHAFTAVKSNLTATVNPTPSNDNTQQYVVGSIWVNTVTNIYFVASNVTTNAAVWTPVLPVGTTAGTVTAGNDSRILGALQATNNLSDVNSASTARSNLGLSAAATAPFGTTAGTVAQGNDSRITGALQSTNNLADVSSVPSARANLFLGTSATRDVGTTAGTVAAGDDSRITGAAQKNANLSDLGSTASARSNLGLGGAATENVGTTAGTVAAGDDSRIVGAIQTGQSASGDLSSTYPGPTVVATHLSSPLPIVQGGTGSSTQNFVDLTSTQTVGGVKNFTSSPTVPAPSGATDVVNKTYADSIASGLSVKTSSVAGTTTALPSNTYNNGASGVGATLTATATGTLTVDGHLTALNDLILVKNEAAPANNGTYKVTTAGAAGVAYVLTRTTDMDQPAEIPGAFTFVTSGTQNASTGWIVFGSGPYVLGTTAINFTLFSNAATISVGTGLTQAGTVISLTVPVAAGNLPSATTSAFGIVEFDGTAGDIQPLGTQSAGAIGKVADAGHVHPTTGVTLHNEAATSVVSETAFDQGAAVGTAVTYARSDHTHGTPPLATTAPSVTEAIGTTTVLGTSTKAAKEDHVHPMAAAGTPTTSAVGDATATGAATTFAASNHVHGRESFGAVVAGTSYGQASSNGVSTSVARADHTHGTPALTSTAPATTEAIGTVAALGVATTPSRADHVHPMAGAGSPASSAVGDTTSTGSATTFAASDHVHAREGFGAVSAITSYGVASANGSATTVSHSDHNHGSPALASSAPATTEAIGTAAALGSAVTPARADHVHPMAAAGLPTNSAVGNSASTGSATTFAASDHVHGRESFGAVTPLTTFGASSADGSATTVSHSDHTHGSPSLPAATTGAQGIVQLAGDLGGTSTSPSVLKVNGISVTGTPAMGKALVGDTASAASWQFNPYLFGDTGIAYGGVISFHSGQPTQFDISAGVGYIVDNVTVPTSPTVTKVTISAQTIDLTTFSASPAPTTRTTNWWLVNSSGTVVVQGTTPTNTQRRTMLVLGVTGSVVSTGVLFNVQPVQTVQSQPGNQAYDLMYALAPFYTSGNVIAPNGANLSFNKSAGTMFDASFNSGSNQNDPHVTINPVETPTTFRNSTQVAGSQGSLVTTMDVTHFDSGGTVTLIPGGGSNSSIQRVWLFGTQTSTAQVAVQYGQATYTSLANAKAALGLETYVVNPDYTGIASLLAWVIVTKQCTSLQDTANCLIVQAAKFAVP